MRTRRLLWAGALLRMGDNSILRGSCQETRRTRDIVGQGGRRDNGQTARQGVVGYLALWGTEVTSH